MAPVNKEAIRILAMEIGLRPAARKLGLNEDTVCSWADREGWNIANIAKNGRPSVASTLQASPADVLQNELARLERETKLSLAKSAARMSHEATEAKLKQSSDVHNVAKTAAIVHRWDAKEQQSANIVVNVALLGVDPATVAATTLDVDPGVSE